MEYRDSHGHVVWLGWSGQGRSRAHTARYGRSIDDQRRRRLRRATGDSVFGTEDDKVAMLRTGSRGDEQGVIVLVVESVADVLAGWPLLLGGRRRRKADPREPPIVVQQRHPIQVDPPTPQLSR